MMRKQRSIKKILRSGIPTFKIRNQFTMPESNRYFAKVEKNKDVISRSLNDMSTHEPQNMENKSSTLNRSISLSLSRKMSHKNDSIHELNNSISLPKINLKKLRKGIEPNQIFKSQIGCLNTYNILKIKQQMDERIQEKLRNKQVTRMSSFMGQNEQFNQSEFDEQSIKQVQEELPYEKYDEILMQKEPTFYRKRNFKLKHQAQWRVVA